MMNKITHVMNYKVMIQQELSHNIVKKQECMKSMLLAVCNIHN